MVKKLTDEEKLRILSLALEADDIRPLLGAEKLKRKGLVQLASNARDGSLITEAEFNRIAASIEKPRSFPADPEQRLDAILSGVVNLESKQILTVLLGDNPQSPENLAADFVDYLLTEQSIFALTLSLQHM